MTQLPVSWISSAVSQFKTNSCLEKNLLLTSYSDYSKDIRNGIADEAVNLLLNWEKKEQEKTSAKKQKRRTLKYQISPPDTVRIFFPPFAIRTMLRNEIE